MSVFTAEKIEGFTAEQNDIVRLYAIIAKAGRNVLADYRDAVDTEMNFGADDSAAHASAVRQVAKKYRIR